MSNDRRLLLVLRPFTGLFVLAMVASALAALFDGVTTRRPSRGHVVCVWGLRRP